MKHSFAPNHDLEICPLLRRIQSCRWGRQTQPGKSVAITTSTNVTELCVYVGAKLKPGISLISVVIGFDILCRNCDQINWSHRPVQWRTEILFFSQHIFQIKFLLKVISLAHK